MVAAGPVDMTVLKAKFGTDIRKSALRHNNDLTLNDLSLMLQRVFNIASHLPFTLKYRDLDGDLITLADDSDLLLALQNEPTLFVEIFIDNRSSKSSGEIQEHLKAIQASVDRLATSIAHMEFGGNDHSAGTAPPHLPQQNGCFSEVAPVPLSASPAPSPTPLAPPPATIQPSLHEQVLPDGNQQLQQAHNESASVLEEDIPLGADASSVLSHQTQLSGHQLPPQQQHHAPQPPVDQHFAAPPFQAAPSAVPSFPSSQAPPPPQTSSFAAPVPVPEQAPSLPPTQQQQFVPPPQFGAPPQSAQSFPPQSVPSQQFAPPPQFGGPGPQPTPPAGSVSSTPIPPQQFAPHPQYGQGPPPPAGPVNQVGGPGGPPHVQTQHGYPGIQFAPQQHTGFPPGSIPAQFPGGQQVPAPEPSQTQPQFAPPTQAPPPSFPPSGGFAPPVGAPPMMPPGGAPGGNPFARGPAGPGYRQSPYHH